MAGRRLLGQKTKSLSISETLGFGSSVKRKKIEDLREILLLNISTSQPRDVNTERTEEKPISISKGNFF
jgi:hypothetical protein